MNKHTKNTLTFKQRLVVLDWLRANADKCFKGKTFKQVAEMATNTLELGCIAPNTISAIAQDGGVEWEKPYTQSGDGVTNTKLKALSAQIEDVEIALSLADQRLRKIEAALKIPTPPV